jgi:hypothetical protein
MKTNARILQQARLMFNQHGVAEVSTVDIAQALNISPGNLYYHFKNKQDLLIQLCEQCHQRLRPILEMLAIGQASWQELNLQILHLLELLAESIFITQDSLQICGLSPKLKHRLQWMRQQLTDTFVDLFSGYAEHGALRQDLQIPVAAHQMALHCWYALADQRLQQQPINVDLACQQLMAQLEAFIRHE